MQEFVISVKSIPIWISISGSILVLLSFATLKIKQGRLGKFKLLLELYAGIGTILLSFIGFLRLFG